MPLTRRTFVTATLAGLACGTPRPSQAMQLPLTASVGNVQLAPAGFPTTEVWAFGEAVPGPEIRQRQGDILDRRFVNMLSEPSSVHWHGIGLPNAMDGVAGLTQDPVPPGESFDYRFEVPDAGTYWYHAHTRSYEQVARGLAGPLIIEEADGGPDVDRDLTLMLQDWRIIEPAAISPDFDNLHDRSHAGRLGNYVTVNGMPEFAATLHRNERVRLRLINAAPARIFELSFEGLAGWIVAVDGMPLETPRAIGQTFVPPGGRVDVVVDVTAPVGESAFVLEILRAEGFALATFTVAEPRADRREEAVAPLAQNPGQIQLDPFGAALLPLLMDGGAMRGLTAAIHNGETLSGRDLADKGLVWALNGTADLPEDPLASLRVGDSLRIPIQNATAFPHAMHLHGHHVREILPSGELGLWRDTVIVDPGQTRDIVFQAVRPGKWLFHCHMLQHAAAGMMTWIDVTA